MCCSPTTLANARPPKDEIATGAGDEGTVDFWCAVLCWNYIRMLGEGMSDQKTKRKLNNKNAQN